MEKSNYMKYRGKCKQFSEFAVFVDPTLKLIRGHYHCPIWGEQPHWWTVRPDGSIYDPTVKQFPSGGCGDYVEFDGIVNCFECGKKVPEEQAIIMGNGNYAVCSDSCAMSLIGL